MEIVNDIMQVEKGKLTSGKDESEFEAYKVVAYILMEKRPTFRFQSHGSQLKMFWGNICVYRITFHIPGELCTSSFQTLLT